MGLILMALVVRVILQDWLEYVQSKLFKFTAIHHYSQAKLF